MSIQGGREVRDAGETDVLWETLGGVGSSFCMSVLGAIHSMIASVCLHSWA